MKRSRFQVLLRMGLGAAAGLLLTRAAEDSVELPEVIATLVRKAFPASDVIRVRHEAKHDDVEYDVRLENRPDGHRISLEVSTEAGIKKIEEELTPDDLPPKVQRALRNAYPSATVVQAQRESEIRLTYEIDITVEGKRRELRISPRGKILDVD